MRLPISVVCAVIEAEDGRVLVAQRPPHKHLGLKWEFPGGKVEPGEAPEAALGRELREEMGCEVHVLRSLRRSTHDYGTVLIEMIPFVARLVPGSPSPVAHEHVGLRWIAREALSSVDLAPADWPVVREYLAQSRGSNPGQV